PHAGRRGRRLCPDQLGEAPSRRARRLAGADRDDVLEMGRVRAHVLDERHQASVGDDRHRLGVVQLVLDLALAVGRVHRAGDRADAGDRVERDDVLRAVRRQDADAVALLHAERRERPREAVGQRLELAIGQAHLAKDDRDVLGIALDAVREHLVVRNPRILEGRPEEFGAHRVLARSRRVYFWTLPVEVVGSAPNTTVRGIAKCGRFSRQKAISSSAGAWASGRSGTTAHGVLPHFWSGRATTADSRTAGWRLSAISTSIDEMFSPPEMMMSFARSLISM